MKYVPNVDITLHAYTLDFILYGELVGLWPCLVPPLKFTPYPIEYLHTCMEY